MKKIAMQKVMRRSRPTNEEAAEHGDGKIHYSRSDGNFLMSNVASATHMAVKMKRKSDRAKHKVQTKQRLMWSKFMSARDSATGAGFNQSSWLQDHHDKKGRAERKKRKREERHRRKREETPTLPKLKEIPLEETTMTPFIKNQRKRPFKSNLLKLPTPMGKKNFAEMMGRYESYELGMKALHEKTVARAVSKDFLQFVLTQERRQRAKKIREKEEAKENQRKLKRALARLKNKQIAGAFHTWEEMWDTMKRMRCLMQKIAGDTKGAIFTRWIEFKKICVEERMTAYNNLSEYAIVIQSWIRMFQAIEYVDDYKRQTIAARVIQRMIRAWHARNLLIKAKAHHEKEAALRKKVRNRLFYAVQHRIFDAWSEWTENIAALKRFVKKHMLGGVTKAFHAWIEGVQVQKEEKDVSERLRKFMHKNMLGGVRKGLLAWIDAVKNIKLLRFAKNKLVHGKIYRIFVAWSDYCLTQKRIKKFMNKWKNAEIHYAFETWHEEAHRAVRIRHLARKLFLGATAKAYEGWKMIYNKSLLVKNVAARRIQGLYHIWYGKNFLKRARKQIRDDELAELDRNHAAGKDDERHRLMKIKKNDPVVTKRLQLLHGELRDAMESSTGYFDSKSLHDQFDLHQQGTYVMSSLRKELINETLRLVQRRSNQTWYNELAEKESKKWGRGWERNHQYQPIEKIRREILEVHTLHDHFPEDGIPTAGKSITFQGTFQDFEQGLKDSLKEWKFMEAQGWISHKQYIQWIVRGTITNVKEPEKKLVSWNLLKEEMDENTFAEICVVLGNNELIERLGGQHMATHYFNDAVHT